MMSKFIKIVGITILLYPLWWVLGVEQFVWLIFFVLLFSKNFRLVGKTSKWFLVFIVIHFVSIFFIAENYRVLTFLRTYNVYLSAFSAFLIITNSVRSWRDIEFILKCLTFALGIACLIGILAIFNVVRPEFQSIVGYIVPSSLKDTMYGSVVFFKTTGHESWFLGIGDYFRVKSTFLYATMYGPVLSVFIPLLLFEYSRSRKTWLLILIVLCLINLFFTTARASILSFLMGFAYFAFIRMKKNGRFMILISSLIVITIAFLMYENLLNSLKLFLLARGEGSVSSRSLVYYATLKGFWERPLFGWGTERDVEGLLYPAGSHSHYLAILYKQGLFGFIAFIGTYISLWFETKPLKYLRYYNSTAYNFLVYGRWIILAIMINSFTDVLDLDATTYIIVWIIFSLLLTARRLCQRRCGA